MVAKTSKTKHDGLAIVHVALYRMGTMSMAKAYQILGYETHHINSENVYSQPWDVVEQAAEATWPSLQGARPHPPFKREDWEKLWDPKYEVVTDIAAPFADQLATVYPDAKVVIVQRDFETWWPSYQAECLDFAFPLLSRIFHFLAWHTRGIRAGYAARKVHLGFFGAKDRAEIEANARQAYERYFDRVRKTIPPERRLEYKIGDGWEPLCAFLGKEVPDVPFPRLNDRAAHNKGRTQARRKVLVDSAKKIASWAVGVVAISAAIRYAKG
ncbi:hypothetical protein F4861DRAFT_502925 [Xylaria intraflava]|nr:hypothetical protein F4861DRAFT_502925 [Xylaria intraflava]